jgi:hypothetical protein
VDAQVAAAHGDERLERTPLFAFEDVPVVLTKATALKAERVSRRNRAASSV